VPEVKRNLVESRSPPDVRRNSAVQNSTTQRNTYIAELVNSEKAYLKEMKLCYNDLLYPLSQKMCDVVGEKMNNYRSLVDLIITTHSLVEVSKYLAAQMSFLPSLTANEPVALYPSISSLVISLICSFQG
jgi:hypothetical protein